MKDIRRQSRTDSFKLLIFRHPCSSGTSRSQSANRLTGKTGARSSLPESYPKKLDVRTGSLGEWGSATINDVGLIRTESTGGNGGSEENRGYGLGRRCSRRRTHGVLPNDLANDAGILIVGGGRRSPAAVSDRRRTGRRRQCLLVPVKLRQPQKLELGQQQTGGEGDPADASFGVMEHSNLILPEACPAIEPNLNPQTAFRNARVLCRLGPIAQQSSALDS